MPRTLQHDLEEDLQEAIEKAMDAGSMILFACFGLLLRLCTYVWRENYGESIDDLDTVIDCVFVGGAAAVILRWLWTEAFATKWYVVPKLFVIAAALSFSLKIFVTGTPVDFDGDVPDHPVPVALAAIVAIGVAGSPLLIKLTQRLLKGIYGERSIYAKTS